MPAFLVSGATGHQGGAVARELLAAGAKVHALVRDPNKSASKELEALGATLFVGDFGDIEAITKAAAGVKGIFINPWPDFTNIDGEAETVRNFVTAAFASGTVDTLVLSTSFRAASHMQWFAENPEYPFKAYAGSKFAADEAVRNSGIKHWTILHPPWLLYNYMPPGCRYQLPELFTEHKLRNPIPMDAPIAHADAGDVGRFAAAAFLEPERFDKEVIVWASESISLREFAKKVEAATGVSIETETLDINALKRSGDPVSVFKGITAEFLNAQGYTLSEEQLAKGRSFGVRFTTVDEFIDKNKARIVQLPGAQPLSHCTIGHPPHASS